MGPRDLYDVFWSDTARGFHATMLFVVNPGDEIKASLTHDARRWTVAIADLTSHQHARFLTSEEGKDSFDSAQWVAEDVARNRQGEPLPYPRTSTVRFDQIAVNGAKPTYAEVSSEWMSLPSSDLAPTVLNNDSFAVVPATLSPAAGRFIEIAKEHDAALGKFDAQLVRWTATTDRSEITKACHALITAISNERQTLASDDWPAAAKQPISELDHNAQALINRARNLTVVSRERRPATTSALRQTEQKDSPIARAARRALHAPDINPE